ncbi:LysE family transporter [Propionivibrio dicarboxylicus]|uniref:Resistance to homoserine/threonine (RhtB) family protein n=1 Tax=Propionivibrio dicarboxylicus TaxID=83767 RepID=A0A1G7ZA48_9RHOO|nr:LysE family transporter [Propionivibrio dicarboxylicus]SDH05578.1 resistance to homoserine/threonine (RhtB) family protein [Propionivibrio dicarboxylicus]
MIEAFAVITVTILAVISPGADFAMVTRNSMLRSRRAGVLTACGIALGVLVHVTYAIAGVSLLMTHAGVLLPLIKAAGAVYLVYLGIGMLRARPADSGSPTPVSAALSDAAALRIGFLTNALNPKTTLFVVSLFTQVIAPQTPLSVRLAYGAFMSLAHLVWFMLVAYAFSSTTAQGIANRCRHLIERAIGLVLVALGLALAVASTSL